MIKKHLALPSLNEDRNPNASNDTTTHTTGAETSNVQQQRIPPPSNTINTIEINIAPEEAVSALSQTVESRSITKKNLHFVRIRDQLVSRLELEATRNVILSVGICLLFFSPWFVCCVLSLICNASVIRQGMSKEETEEALVEQCSIYYWAISYTRLILLIGHTIYQFIGFVTRRKDLCAGLGRSHGRRCIECCGTRRPAKKYRHRQRMTKMNRPSRYNGQPRVRLRFEHTQGNKRNQAVNGQRN